MRLLHSLLPAALACLAGHAMADFYDASRAELNVNEGWLAGDTTRYRDVALRVLAMPTVLVNDARATSFSYDTSSATLHLPSVVFQGRAYNGVRVEGARFEVLRVGSTAAGTVQAFPGAQGFGAQASGGRGGRVIAVTNLNPAGPGSLQAALDEEGPRTVVFTVSGLIDAAIHLTRGDVTIAGQTSPGGISIRQFHTTEEPFCDQNISCITGSRRADNWILRHVRIRPDGRQDDGLRMRYTRRAIVDQVSIGGATDEAVEISFANDVTIQNSIIAETVGEHADRGGVLINYSNPAQGYALTRLALHHNVFNRILGRYPEFSRESAAAAGSVMDVELSNNLYWDMGYFIDMNNTTVSASDSGQPIYYRMNLVGNQAIVRGPTQPEPNRYGLIHIAIPQGASPLTSTWFSGNRVSLYPGRSDYALMYCCNDYPDQPPASTLPAWAAPSRHNFPFISYTDAANLAPLAVARAGSFPRDPMDQRLMSAVERGEIAPQARSINPAGDGSALPVGIAQAAPADSDGDGMSDAWEVERGLNPSVQDRNGTQLSLQWLGVAGTVNLFSLNNQAAARRVEFFVIRR